ncbi:hypothetical protein [Paenibacillus abyssi]|uniref:Uncharacterized protein n=1 Tax=Paenibacillus abyssi TaxID=1340531 RepID=A0A917G1S8_9BACL|nr:hypothetical protein [Paenibacillus abyssi]GGG18214.1 hypothetical protein GCM10010916_38800 [Paenibacillus abyssi]
MNCIKGRSLHPGDRVQVYLNLNKGSCFSIRRKKTGLVLAYADSVTIQNAEFKVSSKGRARVIASGVRAVHAYVEGEFLAADGPAPPHVVNVGYYNPFKTEYFIDECTKERVERSQTAHCQNRRVYFH